ncbi:hypothetical protein KQX54_017360 [Cotesia glomerata]|uniref:Uncharacterized protein n=1 Tax=Cotesia glomerata TaxID=32391 RepID=A0AAV7IED4_COTGL|nr:hypothetical protein KQX54_017360 [Cotesia glomerata]
MYVNGQVYERVCQDTRTGETSSPVVVLPTTHLSREWIRYCGQQRIYVNPLSLSGAEVWVTRIPQNRTEEKLAIDSPRLSSETGGTIRSAANPLPKKQFHYLGSPDFEGCRLRRREICRDRAETIFQHPRRSSSKVLIPLFTLENVISVPGSRVTSLSRMHFTQGGEESIQGLFSSGKQKRKRGW